MGHLLDSVFSKYMTKRGNVTNDLIAHLKNELRAAMKKWTSMGLSMTPKFHLLLEHAIDQLI